MRNKPVYTAPEFKNVYSNPTYGYQAGTFETLSENFYTGLRQLGKDFCSVFRNDAKNTYKAIDHNKAYLGSVLAAVTFSAIANYSEAKTADLEGLARESITNWSLVAEIATHAAVSLISFIGIKMYADENFKKDPVHNFWPTFKDKKKWLELKDIIYSSVPVSLGLYPPIRDLVADQLMQAGTLPEKATMYSQLILTLPYYLGVITAKEKILPYVKEKATHLKVYVNKKKIEREKRKNASILLGVDKSIDDLVEKAS